MLLLINFCNNYLIYLSNILNLNKLKLLNSYILTTLIN